MLLIGSHVSMNGKEMMVGSVKEALSYGANCLMVYTGAPQNTRRKPTDELMIKEAQELMIENGLELKNVIAVATSLSVAILPSGILLKAYLLNFLSAKYFLALGVATNVGQTLLTLILYLAKSTAMPLVKPSIPNFVIL